MIGYMTEAAKRRFLNGSKEAAWQQPTDFATERVEFKDEEIVLAPSNGGPLVVQIPDFEILSYYVIAYEGTVGLYYISGQSNGETFYSEKIEDAIDFMRGEAVNQLAGANGFGICYHVKRVGNRILSKKNVTKQLTPKIVDGKWIDRYYSREDRAHYSILRSAATGEQLADAIHTATKEEAEAVDVREFDLWEPAAPKNDDEIRLKLGTEQFVHVLDKVFGGAHQ